MNYMRIIRRLERFNLRIEILIVDRIGIDSGEHRGNQVSISELRFLSLIEQLTAYSA